MTNEASLLSKAAAAGALLDSKPFQEVMEDVEQGLLNSIKSTELGDLEKREEAFRIYYAMRELKRTLMGQMAVGANIRAAKADNDDE